MPTKLEKDVLAKITPKQSEKDTLTKATHKCIRSLTKELRTHPISIAVGGSLAKDTNLTGNNEVDLFVAFDYSSNLAKAAKISEYLKKAVHASFGKENYETLHGSRDYYQVKIKGILFEMIPIIKIEEAKKALNITDISPLHAKWINEHAQIIKDDIRLTKQFAKSAKTYGAESYLAGFSGYMLEILVTHYGSFEDLLKAAAKWKKQVVVDAQKFYTKREVFYNINKSKLQSPIIMVDPVDKRRNAAAALGEEKFKLFSKAARAYLKRPSASFFEIEKIDLKTLAKKAKAKKCSLVSLQIEPLEGKRDVIGAKLLKVFSYLRTKLEGYGIAQADWEWEQGEDATMFFTLKKKIRPLTMIKQGPPVKLQDHATQFRKRNKVVVEKGGKLYAKVTTLRPELEDFLQHILETTYLKEKIAELTSCTVILSKN